MPGEMDVRDNETRRSIYKHIINYPGVPFTVLKEIFGIPEGTLRYHLRYLERKKQVRSRLENGRRCYYSAERAEEGAPILTPGRITLTSVQERVLSAVRKRDGTTQKVLCSLTGLNRFTLMYNLKKLISMGLVRQYTMGREVHYEYISRSRLEREILRRAAVDLLYGRIDEDTFEMIVERLGKE
ncbi:MAG: hypothetical protein ACMUHU_04310 [Thermoplasmatota archaeon]